MTSIIKADTFVANAEQPEHGYWIEGTVEVTIRNDTRRVRAQKNEKRNEITAYEMSGRYLTGKKAWPACVIQRTHPETGKPWESAMFGRDDRSGRFNKMNAIFFAD